MLPGAVMSVMTVQPADAATGERLAAMSADSSHDIASFDFSPDDRRLAVASVDQQILVWDLALIHRGLADLGLERPGGPSFPAESHSPNALDVRPAFRIDVRLAP